MVLRPRPNISALTKDTRAFIIRESRPRMPPSLALLCMTRSFSEICEVKHFSSGRHCSRNNQSIYWSHGGGNDCPSSILFWCRAAIPPPTRKGCFVKGAPSLVTRKNVSSSDPNRGRLRPLSFPSPSRFSFTSRTLNCLLPSARAPPPASCVTAAAAAASRTRDPFPCSHRVSVGILLGQAYVIVSECGLGFGRILPRQTNINFSNDFNTDKKCHLP